MSVFESVMSVALALKKYNNLMSEELKISAVQLQYQVKTEGSTLLLSFIGRSALLAEHLSVLDSKCWVPAQFNENYKMSFRDSCFIFEHQYVLSDFDHSSLTVFLEQYMRRYLLYEISYLSVNYEGQVQLVLQEMLESRELITTKAEKIKGKDIMVILIYHSARQQAQSRWNSLKKFRQQAVVYPLDEYLQKSKLKPEQYKPFVEGLLWHYEDIIKNYILKQLQRLGLQHDLVLHRIRPIDSKELPHLQRVRVKYGVVLEIIAHEYTLSKTYQALERWFQKANWIILEVDQIQCCPRDKIREWFLEKRRMRAVLVSLNEAKNNRPYSERVVVFAPRMDKPHLQKQLCTAKRLITGLMINVEGRRKDIDHDRENRFHLIYKYKGEFKRFMAGERGGQSNLNMKIYQEYILVECDPQTELRIREQIKKFLQSYQEEEVRIHQFTSPFHIAIFKHFYSSSIRTKPINLYVQNNQLIRHNSKQISEQAEAEISEIYKLMRRQLIYKPLARALPIKKDYFSVSAAPLDWMTPECLECRQYKVGEKLTIYLRSYGSLTNSDDDCIFLVEDFQECQELKEILKQQEINRNFEQVLRKNKIMKLSLRYCRYFENIIVWQKRKFRGHSANSRCRQQIESLFGNSNNQMAFKFMFPARSEALIQTLLPLILQALLKSCNFERAVSKEVTFYTSCQQGPSLRKQIIQQLLRFKNQPNLNLQRISDLDLRLEDIEKIVQYKYVQLKYYQEGVTKCASPLNSFIFSREVLKKGKTPIFLPIEDNKRYSEYLVSYFSQQIYEVRQGRINRLDNRSGQIKQLKQLALLLKQYFRMLDYVVLYGRLDNGVLSLRLLYNDSKENMFEQFRQLEVNIIQKKVDLKENSRRVRYKIVFNEFLQLYRVQTHPSKVAELNSLKNCVAL